MNFEVFMRFFWHFGGLLLSIIGAWHLGGWAASAIVFGAWCVFGTMNDSITRRL